MEKKLSDTLGTRVSIEKREVGGKIHIDFFDNNDLLTILNLFSKNKLTVPEITDIPMDDRTPVEKKEDENTEDLYSVSNFVV